MRLNSLPPLLKHELEISLIRKREFKRDEYKGSQKVMQKVIIVRRSCAGSFLSFPKQQVQEIGCCWGFPYLLFPIVLSSFPNE